MYLVAYASLLLALLFALGGAGAGVEKKAEDDRRGQPVLQGKIMAFDGRVRAPFVPCQLEIAHVRYPCGCPVVPFPD